MTVAIETFAEAVDRFEPCQAALYDPALTSEEQRAVQGNIWAIYQQVVHRQAKGLPVIGAMLSLLEWVCQQDWRAWTETLLDHISLEGECLAEPGQAVEQAAP